MCLSTVLKRYTVPSTEVKTGFKVIFPISSHYYRVPVLNKEYEYDQWETATGTDIRAVDGNYYPTGFHIFSRYNDAVEYRDRYHVGGVVVQVEYSEITTRGTQDGLKVVVTSKMKVLSH